MLPNPEASGHIHSVQLLQTEWGERHVFACGTDRRISHWICESSSWRKESNGILAEAELLLLRCSPDLRFVAVADREGSVSVYALDGWQLVQRIAFGPLRVHSLAWAGSDLLAIGTSDKSIRIILVNEGGAWKEAVRLQGHTNWATCLDWTPRLEGGIRLLASSGPDKTVRLWKLHRKADASSGKTGGRLEELVVKKNVFRCANEDWAVECEAILYGHEGTVNSCRWSSGTREGGPLANAKLISSSTDHTLIVWGPLAGSWATRTHLGEIGGGSGSLGQDRSFGFYSGILLCESEECGEATIIGHGSKGSIQFWQREAMQWATQEPLTGHCGPVQACAWDAEGGRYLLTVSSLDQTTRAWAPVNPAPDGSTWAEVARPQIHGYDMQCIATVDGSTFLSGADEKIVRAFRAPDTFLKRIRCLARDGPEDDAMASERPVFVPALGLSNKDAGIGFDLPGYHCESSSTRMRAEMPLGRAPSEADLCRQTLWPELDKLYGHGYEIYSLAVAPGGRLAASASKANLAADGAIRFWMREGDRWLAAPHGVVPGHALTIVSLAFSPDGRHLLATSRDRSWSITMITSNEDGSMGFRMVQREEAAHARIIWAAAWVSPAAFLTASRDATVKHWALASSGVFVCSRAKTLQAGVTAVAYDQSSDTVAVGLETGALSLFRLADWDTPVIIAATAAGVDSPAAAINGLAFRPGRWAQPVLACVSDDRSLRLYTVTQEDGDRRSF